MSAPACDVAGAAETARALTRWGAARGWQGPDPYEALNARRVPAAVRRSVLARRVLTQIVKRSPIDPRPALGIEPRLSAAAVALVASAYATAELEPDDRRAAVLDWAVDVLDRLRSPGYDEACWGYHFDVQTRVFFYPAGSPNTIATAFAGRALLDIYEQRGEDDDVLATAGSVGDFFLRHVPQTASSPGAYFGYLPGDRTPIHNASMLVAALLARLSVHTGRADFAEASREAVTYTVARQRDDGSWPYGEETGLGWVDGFHTGYVVEALLAAERAGADVPGLRPSIARGLAQYRRDLFLPDGTPKYEPSSLYPIDIQSAAQGIQTFALARDPFAWSVYCYARRALRRRDGAFSFQRRRLWTNSTPHVRWGQAPMLLALAHLLRAFA